MNSTHTLLEILEQKGVFLNSFFEALIPKQRKILHKHKKKTTKQYYLVFPHGAVIKKSATF